MAAPLSDTPMADNAEAAPPPAESSLADDPLLGYTLFDTPVGRCGLAWRKASLAAAQLPEPDDARTLGRLLGHLPERGLTAAPPVPTAPSPEAGWSPLARSAIDQVRALLSGRPENLADLPLDMRGVPVFHQQIYALIRRLPPGATLTYGEIAHRLGQPGAARGVGQALGHNPFAPIVPCHRVLAAGHRAGGFSAAGGVDTKLRLLALESADRPAAASGSGPGDDLFGWQH